MSEIVNLIDLPVGQLGEIVELAEEQQTDIFQKFGAAAGMSVMILHQAVEWLVQIGYTQMHMNGEYLQKIKVKPI